MASGAPHYCLVRDIPIPCGPGLWIASFPRDRVGRITLFGCRRVGNLACSWPLFQVFDFYWNRGGYLPLPTKYPTLRGLVSLVTSCPKSRMVSLPPDATHVLQVNDTESCNLKTHFERLTLPESPIDQPPPVAEFLSTYLPCVIRVDAKLNLRLPETNVTQIKPTKRRGSKLEVEDTRGNSDAR